MTFRFSIAVTALMICAAVLYASQQPPAVVVTPATPNTVYVNSTTTVSVMAQITDSRVIANGVNLLQIDPLTGSQTVVGMLHDDGLNGDAVAGDHIFTVLVQPPTAHPALLTYQISAAFVGILKRSLAGPITVVVVPPGAVVPDDPGPSGTLTLAGIDRNGNGVRDDVERLIAAFALPSSSEVTLQKQAVVIQTLILGQPTAGAIVSSTLRSIVIDRCLQYLLGGNYQNLTKSVQAAMLNTPARLAAFLNTSKQAGAWTTEGLPLGATACQTLQ